jgi:hypothetical protein
MRARDLNSLDGDTLLCVITFLELVSAAEEILISLLTLEFASARLCSGTNARINRRILTYLLAARPYDTGVEELA